MRVHMLQHVPFEGLGSIESWLAGRGAEISVTRLFEPSPLPRLQDIDWLVVMGGPMSVNDEATHPWLIPEKRFIADAIAASKTVLGICLGAQLIARCLGARVRPTREREIGWFPIEPTSPPPSGPFAGIFQEPLEVFHWHGETFELPPAAELLARSAACERQAFSIGTQVVGLQFHLETTPDAARAMIENIPDDLEPGPWVQPAAQMLGEPARFARVNGVMDALLDRLDELSTRARHT